MLVLLGGAAMAWDPANTVVSNAAGTITVTGTTSHALHEHGGAPAKLGHASFVAENTTGEAVEISAGEIGFLTGHSCNEPPSDRRSAFPATGMTTAAAPVTAPTVVVPPRSTLAFEVGFPFVDAYYSWCDRYAFQVSFLVGGEPLVSIAETEVSRISPGR